MEDVLYLAEKGSAAYGVGQALGPACLVAVLLALLVGLYRLVKKKN